MEIDFSPVLDELLQIVAVLLAAGAAYLGKKISDWFNLKKEDEMRVAVQSVLHNAAEYIHQRLSRESRSAVSRIEVNDPLIASAIQYVNNAVPQGLRYFGIDDEGILVRLEVRTGIDINRDGVIGNAT